MEKGFELIGMPVWFSLHGGETVGIVLMNNGFEDKAFIGRASGVIEEEDIEFILSWGTPFPVESARLMCGGSR